MVVTDRRFDGRPAGSMTDAELRAAVDVALTP